MTSISIVLYGRQQGRNGREVGIALVDASDAVRIGAERWYRGGRGRRYAVAVIGQKTVLMHRMVLSVTASKEVRHRNGDLLDNRRANLLVVDVPPSAAQSRSSCIGLHDVAYTIAENGSTAGDCQ